MWVATRKFSLHVVVGAAAAAGAVSGVVSLLCAHRPSVNSVKSWSLSTSPPLFPPPSLLLPSTHRRRSQSVSPSLYPLLILEALLLFFVLSHRTHTQMPGYIISRNNLCARCHWNFGIDASCCVRSLVPSDWKVQFGRRSTDRLPGDCRPLIRATFSSLQLRSIVRSKEIFWKEWHTHT